MAEPLYEVLMGEEATGPYTLRQLQEMAAQHEIDDVSPVRRIPHQGWITWEKVQEMNRGLLAKSPYPSVHYATSQLAKSSKSRGIFIIIGLLFGCLGFHNFYAGYFGRGFVQFFLSMFGTCLLFLGLFPFTTIIVAFWAFAEVMIVTTDGEGLQLS
jgi:TM2 domain-containing membrane protein YozV